MQNCVYLCLVPWQYGETLILKIAGSKRIRSEVVLIRDLFLSCLILLYKAAFCRVLASVCEAKLRRCIKNLMFFCL